MTATETVVGPDPFDPSIARRASGLLATFNLADVIGAAEVHVALRLGRLGGEDDETVLLAAALAARAPRLGHVCVDLTTIAGTVAVDAELPNDPAELAWPEPVSWLLRLAASPLVTPDDACRPLRLAGSRLYLDRYWREEYQVASDLLARGGAAALGVDPAALADGLARLFASPDRPADSEQEGAAEPDLQCQAAAAAVLRRFTVVAGGPGTGKTTTVARILALLHEQAGAAGAPPALIALAAPTGKAAARLEEAVHEEAARLDVSDATRRALLSVEASTLHRLLGWRPGNRSRFRHHRGNRLPHEVVVVDETSMVSLSLMARLLEAVRSDARLVLVGDPEQLASVEAGAVLGDIVGPAAEPTMAGAGALAEGIVVLRHVHRFGGGIATLAEAVRRGDADAALRLLNEGSEDVTWLNADIAEPGPGASLGLVRRAVVSAAAQVRQAARSGNSREAIAAVGAFRVLCAHRQGPYGASLWMDRIEGWLASDLDDLDDLDNRAAGFAEAAAAGSWYAGRPLLVTQNDYALRLFNGDTGVVVAVAGGKLSAVFERRGALLEFSPSRLAAVDTVYAMTVHKSQGSQFDAVAVLLPDPTSPILTRELLYTAITRARRRLILAGTEAAVRAAITRPIARASGLRHRLWE